MINQYTSIENNSNVTNPPHYNLINQNVRMATGQRQEGISQSLQRVLKTAGNLNCPDLNCVTQIEKTMDFV